MMYNPQLETFLCVVEAGSFNKAAETLYISPPAVIKQINSLEASLDIQLFERTHRGLHVTPAGASLYQDVKYIIQYCRESVARAEHAMESQEEVIRVGISPLTQPQVFVKLWPEIQEISPGLKFQMVPFENTLENAREILGNLGQNIDVVAGIFDDTMLKLRQCNGIEIMREPFCAAVPMDHRLAGKERLSLEDLHGETLLMMHRGWGQYVDMLRDDLWAHHPQIHVQDFDFYDIEIFNRCENSGSILLAVKIWDGVHPLMKMIPVEWDYGMPFGLMYSREPDQKVRKLLQAIETIKERI